MCRQVLNFGTSTAFQKSMYGLLVSIACAVLMIKIARLLKVVATRPPKSLPKRSLKCGATGSERLVGTSSMSTV